MLCVLASNSSKSQSLTGLVGLVSIPTAEIPIDERVTIGVSYYNKNYLNLYGTNYNGLGTYISVTFLPFVEMGFRLTRLIDFPDPQALGDRMPSVRIRLMAEGNILPSILFGAHDFIRTSESKSSYNTATYISMTKNINILSKVIDLKVSIGHGFRLLTSSAYQFEGLFYGVSIKMYDFAEVMAENDSKKFNAGIRVSLFDKISITGAMMDLKNICGTFSYSFEL